MSLVIAVCGSKLRARSGSWKPPGDKNNSCWYFAFSGERIEERVAMTTTVSRKATIESFIAVWQNTKELDSSTADERV